MRHGLNPKVGDELGAKAMATRLSNPAGAMPKDRKRTTGTPRPRTLIVSRQVSWLAGHCLRQAFPGSRPVA
jgi:hypothetical protein